MPSFTPSAKFNETKLCAGTGEMLLNSLFEGLNTLFKLANLPYAHILHSLKTGDLDIDFSLKIPVFKSKVTL